MNPITHEITPFQKYGYNDLLEKYKEDKYFSRLRKSKELSN